MKTLQWIFCIAVCLLTARSAKADLEVHPEHRSANITRYKTGMPSFIPCCGEYKRFRTETVVAGWTEHFKSYAPDTNGDYYLAIQSDLSINTSALADYLGNVTNGSGSASLTETDYDSSGAITSTHSYSATMGDHGVFTNTGDASDDLWWRGFYQWSSATSGPWDFPDWLPDPNPKDSLTDVTNPECSVELRKLKGTIEVDTNSSGTVTFTDDIDFTRTITMQSEFTTANLLAAFADGDYNAWSTGPGTASVSVNPGTFAAPASASMSGSRMRFKVKGPEGNFKIPYVIHTHFDSVNNDTISFAGTNIYQTNCIAALANGSEQYFPSGKPIQIHPVYGTITRNGCDFYINAQSDVTVLSALRMPDGPDGKPCPNNCNACDKPDLQDTTGLYTPEKVALGMPTWAVSEPYINLWVMDNPVAYKSSLGESIAYSVSYKQHDTRPKRINGEIPYLPITGWNNNWYSYVHFAGQTLTNSSCGVDSYSFSNWTATVYLPGGGEANFSSDNWSDSRLGDKLMPFDGINAHVYPADSMVPSGGPSGGGFRLVHPDGSQDIYRTVSAFYPTHYTAVIPVLLDADNMGQPPPSLGGGVVCSCANGWDYCTPGWTTTKFLSEAYEDYTPTAIGFSSAPSGSGVLEVGMQFATNWSQKVVDSFMTNAPADLEAPISADAVLTEHIDPYGNSIHFNYGKGDGQTGYRLQSATDYDGNTTTLAYDTNGYVAEIDMPYGRSATFHYNANTNAELANVTDAEGMTSSFNYADDYLTMMSTPYGVTTFGYIETNRDSIAKVNEGVTRAIVIGNPDGTHEMYAFFNSQTNSSPVTIDPSEVPGPNLDDGSDTNSDAAMNLRNSVHWDKTHFPLITAVTNLCINSLNSLTAADFNQGRLQHWMLASDRTSVSGAASYVREASPDGATSGAKTWYTHNTMGQPWCAADDERVAGEIRYQPDGTVWTQTLTYADPNLLNGVTTHYKQLDGSDGARSSGASYYYTDYALISGGSTFSWSVPFYGGSYGPGYSTHIGYSGETVTNSSGSVSIVYPQPVSANVSDAFAENTTITYNARHQITGYNLPHGLTVTNLFDANGFLSKSIALETHATNTYTFTNGLLATKTDPMGLTTSYSWDNLNRLRTITYPDLTTESFDYDRLDLSGVKDRLNHWTHSSYDSMRRRTASTDRNNNTTLYDYCVCGGLNSVTDPQTNRTVYNRDLNGRITSIVFNNSLTRTFNRDFLGRGTNIVDSGGLNLNYTFDNLDRLVQVASPDGTLYSASYDDAGRPVIVKNAEGVSITNSYDGAERLRRRDFADGLFETWNFDGRRLTSAGDAAGHQTYYDYDVAGHLTSTRDANYNYTLFAYNPAGKLIAMTNANNAVTSWAYNKYGQMIAKTNANGVLVETNGYDAAGRLTAHWTPAKGRTTYTYDNNGNRLTTSYSSGVAVSATYDSLNHLKTMNDAVGTSAFSYQNFGAFWSALNGEDGPWANDSIGRIYANNGLPISFVVNSQPSNLTTSYGYDSLLRLHTIASPAGTFTYNYNGVGKQIHDLALPGSSEIDYAYTDTGMLLSTALKHGSQVLDSYDYTYDLSGWRTNVVRGDSSHLAYGYDNIGQLTSATGFEPNGTTPRLNENLGYLYDPAGNLFQRTNDSLVQWFTTDPANQLTNVLRTNDVMTVAGGLTNSGAALAINGQSADIYSDLTFAVTNLPLVDGNNTFTNVLTVGGSSYTNKTVKNLPVSVNLSYDLNGNMVSDGLKGYDYDCANQLTSIVVTNKTKSEFVYDGLGRRRIRREYAWTGQWYKTSETRYVYDGMLVVQERDGSNVPKVNYTRGLDLNESFRKAGGIGGLLARTDANGSAFYHSDESGNVTAMINSSGALQAKYLYDPYGNLVSKIGPLADVNLYRFSSKEVHLASGLYYYGFRFYEPNLQRWLSQDPVHEHGGLNLYGFVANNPMSIVDARGLQGTLITDPGYTSPWQRSDLPLPPFMNAPTLPEGSAENGSGRDAGSGFYDSASKLIGSGGLLLSGAEYGSGAATIGSNLKIYPRGWGGNGYVCTTKIGELAHELGPYAAGAGFIADGIGYANGDIGLGKWGVNSGFAGLGLWGGPPGAIMAGEYFLIDNTFPGGAEGYMGYSGDLINTNQQIAPGTWTIGYPIIGP